MREHLVELAGQLLLILAYTVGAAVLGAVGLLIEYHSYLYFAAGEYPLAAWIATIGAVVLLFAGLIVRDKLVPSLSG